MNDQTLVATATAEAASPSASEPGSALTGPAGEETASPSPTLRTPLPEGLDEPALRLPTGDLGGFGGGFGGGGIIPLPGPFPLPGPLPTPLPTATSPCTPDITATNPQRALVTASIAIIGSRFRPTSSTCAPDSGNVSVSFGDSHPGGPVNAQVWSATDTQIMVAVPVNAKTSRITVRNTKGQTDTTDADFIVLPSLGTFTPMQGGVGTAVTVFGSGLYNSPKFFFGNAEGEIPAPFTVPGPDQFDRIQIAVPPGVKAGQRYRIRVETKGGGMAMSTDTFLVSAATPQVGNCMPMEGAPGTELTLTPVAGTAFDGITSVSFLTDPNALGQARRIILRPPEFSVNQLGTALKVRVPDGAVTGKIRVCNASGCSATAARFRVPLAQPGAFAARVNGQLGVDLSWRDATTTENGFRLERAPGAFGNDFGFQQIAVLPANTGQYTDATAPLNQPLRYRLKAFNTRDGESRASNIAVATAGGALQLNPIRLMFTGMRDGANPAPQNLLIERGPNRPDNAPWMLTTDQPWLQARPATGLTGEMAGISVDLFGLKSGRYTGVVTAATPGGDSAASATVELIVTPAPGTISVQVVGPEEAA